MVKFTIQGEPVPQGRPRFSSRGGFTRTYDPPKSKDYKEKIKHIIKHYTPLEGNVKVYLGIYISIPKSKPKKFREDCLSNTIRPTKKPDIDNIMKIVFDASNGILFKDDSQVVEVTAEKFYSDNPRVEVEVDNC